MADFVAEIKRESSKWIKSKDDTLSNFFIGKAITWTPDWTRSAVRRRAEAKLAELEILYRDPAQAASVALLYA